jgi:hypothetical protein
VGWGAPVVQAERVAKAAPVELAALEEMAVLARWGLTGCLDCPVVQADRVV